MPASEITDVVREDTRIHGVEVEILESSHTAKARRSARYARWVASDRPPCSRKRLIAAVVMHVGFGAQPVPPSRESVFR